MENYLFIVFVLGGFFYLFLRHGKLAKEVQQLKAMDGGICRLGIKINIKTILEKDRSLNQEFKENKEFKTKKDWIKNALEKMTITTGNMFDLGKLKSSECYQFVAIYDNGGMTIWTKERSEGIEEKSLSLYFSGGGVGEITLFVYRGMLKLSYGDELITEFPLKYIFPVPIRYLNFSQYTIGEQMDYKNEHKVSQKEVNKLFNNSEMLKEIEDCTVLSASNYDSSSAYRHFLEEDSTWLSVLKSTRAKKAEAALEREGFQREFKESWQNTSYENDYMKITSTW